MHANKFKLICWDAAAGRKLWETPELRLKGKGHEVGFEECFVLGNRVVTHGRYDVLAFSIEDGRELWRLRMPHEFDIEHAQCTGNIMILSGRDRTLAVHLDNGGIFWEANEIGAPYTGVFFKNNVVMSVRKNPSGVTFRSLGTGELLTHLDLPPLSVHAAHPVLPAGRQEAVPVSYDGKQLVLTDGWDYILVDTELMRVRWQKRIQSVDRSKGRLPYRLWLENDHMVALKKSYDTEVIEAVATADGKTLWAKVNNKEPEVVYSVVFDKTRVHGLHYSEKKRSVNVKAFTRNEGKRETDWEKSGYDSPEVFIDPEPRGGYIVILVKDKQDYSVLVFDKGGKKLAAELKVKGFGEYGTYGQVSYGVQDEYFALLSGSKLAVASPGK